MVFIIITIAIIYFILIAWTWQSLGFIEKNKKVAFIIIGIILMYVITLIIFHMSKDGINYQSIDIQNKIQNVIVAIFTGINGIIVMPQVGKLLNRINEDEIKKETLKKRIIILTIIFILCLIFESEYMKDTQEGILRVYNSQQGQT